MKETSLVFAVLALASPVWAQGAGGAGAEPTSIEQYLSSPAVPTTVVSPEQPRKKHGEVHLRATIKADGAITNIRVASGKRELVTSTLEAVRQWHYRPAQVDGTPVETEHDFFIDFTRDTGVMLGPDDLSPNLPTQPPPEVFAMVKAGELERVGKNVSAPKPIRAPDPEYSERARQARYSGVCGITTVVGTDGLTHYPWISQPVGEQLDEKALDILKLWRFTPATRDGNAVPVVITVQFKFDIW